MTWRPSNRQTGSQGDSSCRRRWNVPASRHAWSCSERYDKGFGTVTDRLRIHGIAAFASPGDGFVGDQGEAVATPGHGDPDFAERGAFESNAGGLAVDGATD